MILFLFHGHYYHHQNKNFCKWWLAVRLDTLGGIISFFIAALAVSTDNVIPPQYLALSLQNAFATTGMLKTLINMLAQVETMMASIERIKYYSETIEIEENYDDLIEDPEFVKSWPNAGVSSILLTSILLTSIL